MLCLSSRLPIKMCISVMKIALIKEGKTPPDKRVPFTPKQTAHIAQRFKTEIVVQKSPIRAFSAAEYENLDLPILEDISEADVLMGVKEVPIAALIPNKTYFFFSHTIKKQAYNRDLLQAVMQKNITLIDYEALKDETGVRLVGFGRYAGIVGAYNAFRGWGKMLGEYTLQPAHECHDQKEMETQLPKVQLPRYFKIVVTGHGRVAGGVLEILHALKIREVTPKEFLLQSFEEPVFAQISVKNYNKRIDGAPFKKQEFYKNPESFTSDFTKYSRVADMLITAHFWDANAPIIYTAVDAASAYNNIKFVADISCDPNGPIAPSIRASTIEAPFYGYNVHTRSEVAFGESGSIGVMAVDNLPCELPRDASEGFGRELLLNVIPCLLGEDPTDVIGRATITKNGALTPNFAYLQDFVDGK